MTTDGVKAFTARKLDWVRCVSHDPLVPPWAFEIAYCIISHLNAGNGRACVSDETLADESGISERTVRRARKKLQAAEWLRWRRTSTANVYEPLFEKVSGISTPSKSSAISDRNAASSAVDACQKWPNTNEGTGPNWPNPSGQKWPDMTGLKWPTYTLEVTP